MNAVDLQLLDKLDKEDQKKISYFFDLLLEQSKYRTIKKEIDERRSEIKQKDTLTHAEIWSQVNV